MQNTIVIPTAMLVLMASASIGFADKELDDPNDSIRSLQEKVEILEKRVAALESLDQCRKQDQQDVNEVREIGGTPGPIESTNQPVGADSSLKVGQVLQVEWNDYWWAARVIHVRDDGTVGIHYLGWNSSYDETVPRSRLQFDPDAMAKARKTVVSPLGSPNGTSGVPVKSSGIAVAKDVKLKDGQRFYVEWGGQWWIGEVVQPLPDGRAVIHYVGWDSKWDEVVARSRLQIYIKDDQRHGEAADGVLDTPKPPERPESPR